MMAFRAHPDNLGVSSHSKSFITQRPFFQNKVTFLSSAQLTWISGGGGIFQPIYQRNQIKTTQTTS